jgi:hypothetical protein
VVVLMKYQWRRHIGMAPPCGDVMELLMTTRVFPSLCSFTEVGFAPVITIAPDMSFGPYHIFFGLTKRAYKWSLNIVESCSNFGAISSYKLQLRCSLARWIRMDDGKNIMLLDIYYIVMEIYSFLPLRWLSLGSCNSSILLPFGSFPHRKFLNKEWKFV